MSERPFLPLFTDNYLGATRHLTTEQHGAYLLLLMAAWHTPDCTLPNDDKLLARLTGMSPQKWQKIKGPILEFYSLLDTKIVQKRLSKEFTYVLSKREQQSRAGKASALKRNKTTSTSDQRPSNGRTNERTNGNPNGKPTTEPTPYPYKESTPLPPRKKDPVISEKKLTRNTRLNGYIKTEWWNRDWGPEPDSIEAAKSEIDNGMQPTPESMKREKATT